MINERVTESPRFPLTNASPSNRALLPSLLRALKSARNREGNRVRYCVYDHRFFSPAHLGLVPFEARDLDSGVPGSYLRHHQHHSLALALRFETRGDIDVVADGREIGRRGRSHGADDGFTAMNADTDSQGFL